MTEKDFAARIVKQSQKYLGRTLSPHLFRDCAATQIAISAPGSIGITKDLLGHASLASSQKFYNQATSYSAFAQHQGLIERLRRND